MIRTPVQTLELSKLDSARFGLRVFRCQLKIVEERALFHQIISENTDISIIRTPSGAGSGLQRLGRYGLHPIHADTLVHYETDLHAYEPAPLKNTDLAFSEAAPSDQAELNALVLSTFAGYVSHYHANPVLDQAKILAGYVEWASNYISDNSGQRNTWIARRAGQLVAFACCQSDTETACGHGILYGVHPDHSGGGLYGDLIRYTQARYRERGFRCMQVSTQVWNLAVQKVWAREGFRISAAQDTWHVNSMLSAGEVLVDRELIFDSIQVARFAAITGDTNPVHLDDEASRAAGFDAKISHGMLAGSELSRIFGTEIPGAGTLFLRSELAFLAPIYQGRAYRLQVRYPSPLPGRGYIAAVATIRDHAGALCLLAYSDLLKKE